MQDLLGKNYLQFYLLASWGIIVYPRACGPVYPASARSNCIPTITNPPHLLIERIVYHSGPKGWAMSAIQIYILLVLELAPSMIYDKILPVSTRAIYVSVDMYIYSQFDSYDALLVEI